MRIGRRNRTNQVQDYYTAKSGRGDDGGAEGKGEIGNVL